MFDIVSETHLPNGAEIIAANEAKRVVLCWYGGFQPYVTWRVDANGNAFWGHYFQSEIQANQDFLKRIGA
jgi:hypothetical protein